MPKHKPNCFSSPILFKELDLNRAKVSTNLFPLHILLNFMLSIRLDDMALTVRLVSAEIAYHYFLALNADTLAFLVTKGIPFTLIPSFEHFVLSPRLEFTLACVFRLVSWWVSPIYVAGGT